MISLVAATMLSAQTPADSSAQHPSQPSASDANSPQTTKSPSKSDGNPFPGEDTSAPILPTTLMPYTQSGNEQPAETSRSLPTTDTDPAHSPDDPETSEISGGVDTLFSSSLTGVREPISSDTNTADEDRARKGRGRGSKDSAKDTPHQETAASDIQVGNYYLDRKNWKAALSRFQSARILDPESPDAFFGLAVAEQHLGDIANARTHYEKLLEYDPDGPHGKSARKALKEMPTSAAGRGESSGGGGK